MPDPSDQSRSASATKARPGRWVRTALVLVAALIAGTLVGRLITTQPPEVTGRDAAPAADPDAAPDEAQREDEDQ